MGFFWPSRSDWVFSKEARRLSGRIHAWEILVFDVPIGVWGNSLESRESSVGGCEQMVGLLGCIRLIRTFSTTRTGFQLEWEEDIQLCVMNGEG